MDSTNKTSSKPSTDSSNELLINKSPFGVLCNSEEYCDIYFVVGKDNQRRRFPAHKILLCTRSCVFKAMFYGPLATNSHEILVPDVEPSSFLALLKFIYSNEIQIDSETVINTLYAARKYNLQALEDHCINFFKSNLVADNAFLLLTQAQLYDKSELIEMCIEIIDKNATDAFSSDCFIDISYENLMMVLKRDTLQVFESKLFEAVVSWSKEECVRKNLTITAENQRFVLGEALKLIRFSLMTSKEFVSGPLQSDLLTVDEVKEICIELASNTYICEKPRCSGSVEKYCDMNEVIHVYGSSFFEKDDESDREINYVWLDRTVFAVGFVLKQCNPVDLTKKPSITVIQVIGLKDNISYIVSQVTNSHILIKFDRPIEILLNKDYTIKVQIGDILYDGEEVTDIISTLIHYELPENSNQKK